MSTLAKALAQTVAQAAPATQSAGSFPTVEVVFLSVVCGLSAVAVWVACRALRVYRPSAVAGPERLEPTQSVGPLVIVLGVAIVALVVATGVAVATMQVMPTAESRPTGGEIPAGTLVAASVAGPVAAFVASVGLLLLLQPGTLRAIGFTISTLPRGVNYALVAAVIAIPLTFLAGFVTEWVYQWTGYEHPPEHDLLKAMKTTPPVVQALGIAAAVLIAPVVEEFVFRGLLQTSLTELLVRFGRPRAFVPALPPIAGGFEVVGVQVPPNPGAATGITAGGVELPPVPITVAGRTYSLGYETPAPVTPESTRRRRYPRAWIGILATSVLFGLVHPMWMFPIIFFLSLCLGYSYERTGNLWTSIGLHALFNATSTAIYLSGASG